MSLRLGDLAEPLLKRCGKTGETPSQASERSQALIDACGDDREAAAAHYTDGDPIYSICNGDTSLDVLIPA